MKKLFILFGILILATACAPIISNTAPTISAEMVQLWAKQTVDAIVSSSSPQIPIQPQPSPTVMQPIKLIPTQPAVIPTIGYVQPTQRVCDQMGFVADVTVPDDTVFGPNQAFQKVWRIQNTGTCTWTTAYQFVFQSGHQLGQQTAVGLPRNVLPNETIDIAVNMVTPNVNGVYQGFWRMRNASGGVFGTSQAANNAIWVKVRVSGGANEGSVPVGNATGAPSGTGTCTLLSVFPSWNDRFRPGEETDFRVSVRNDSNVVWTASDFDLAYIDGTNMMKRPGEVRRDMPVDVAPGGVLSFALDVIVPPAGGSYTMNWGVVRGFEVFCTIGMTAVVNQ